MALVMGQTPTKRQLEILVLAAQGRTRHEIGAELFISPCTVRNQVALLHQCLGARNTPHAVSICIARGLICVDGRSEAVFIPEPIQDFISAVAAAA